ncbi:Putative virulence factor, partial [Salmonella enterica subsp. enterica serovar Heidelberg str. 607310-1]
MTMIISATSIRVMRQRIWLFAFTRDIFSNENGWPLRLRLISEAELVQIFIAWTSASPICRQVEKSIITSRL